MMKKIVVIALSLVMLLASVVCLQGTGNVTKAADKQVEWSSGKIAYSTTAPTKEGYLFAGWYTEKSSDITVAVANPVDGENYYAKFIPEEMLSVYGQVAANIDSETSLTNMRLLTLVDDLNYKSMGMSVEIGGLSMGELNTREVSEAVQYVENNETKTLAASAVYNSANHFVSVLIEGIPAAGHQTPIYARPFLVTFDGTKVYGVDRFMYVENAYNGTFTVTVRATDEADIVAGLITLQYDKDKLTFKGIEERAFTEANSSYYDNGNGTLKFLGKASDIAKNISTTENGLLVGIKFQKNTISDASDFTFNVSGSFCDKDENLKDITISAPAYDTTVE